MTQPKPATTTIAVSKEMAQGIAIAKAILDLPSANDVLERALSDPMEEDESWLAWATRLKEEANGNQDQ